VQVKFINGRDKTVVATSNMPVEQLPESFQVDTTVELGGRKWSVSSATPADKREFAKTGELAIVLAEITQIPPGDLLYSLPTISNDCGQVVGKVLPHDGLFQIHEDDWRQIEFISESYREAMNLELSDIRAIYEKDRKGVGFKKVHVRKRIPEPFSGVSLSLDELKTYLPQQRVYEAVSFNRTAGTVPHSFAWQSTYGLIVWGTADSRGVVELLCLTPSSSHTDRLPEALSKLAQAKRLVLVDWCRVTEASGSLDAFRKCLDVKN
jgi:hypothetical protein